MRNSFPGLLLLLYSASAFAADLVEIYALAESNDPQYRQVSAARLATLESRPQAFSQLLPSVNLSANTRKNDQDIKSSGGAFGTSGGVEFNSHGYSLSATQPLFRRDRFIALKQADSLIQQAEAELIVAQQDLIVRVAERYFFVLGSMDNLEFSQAEKKSLDRQLDQAKQRFEVGLTAITDVAEAQAGYDLAVAQEIQAENLIDDNREALREITGEYISVLSPLGKSMPLVSPDPANIEIWTSTALEQNPQILSARYAAETTQKEIKLQYAGHLPTLDLVASRNYTSTGGRFGGTKQHSTSIGLELNIPLYEGGLVSSQTREAAQRYNETMEKLEQARRAAQRSTREAYRGVISGISQVNALQQAVVSSETALQATQAGFEVGTRTAVDVVASERTTSAARRDYARTRYDYILNTLRLKQAAGTLSPEDLNLINNWLH
ncbi:MAG: TolC family outer membrane protein [Gammaproteobacteria bacterium]